MLVVNTNAYVLTVTQAEEPQMQSGRGRQQETSPNVLLLAGK